MRPDAILFDFDGVLIESEASGNRHIADYFTSIGHPISHADSMARFMGLAGPEFVHAIEGFVGGPIPDGFHAAREVENQRCMAEGIDEVAGAIRFVRSLPTDLPRAITSSSRVRWIRRHLEHIGLTDAFGDHLYSGSEHVTRGKPAPDLYLHAAAALGVPIERCAIIEDSPVGATGAVASGARVIGLTAATHCGPDHAARLRAIGVDAVAHDFDQVAALLKL
jgi:beta-phosphoglucomutase-like phosphatase (HAD superfamily)